MNAVTIDNFDIKTHERYAHDQANLDATYIQEASSIPHHSEITGTSAIYSSKWEELFETALVNIPWAAFSPPPKYAFQAKRFFSYKIIPSIAFSDEEADRDSEEERDEEEDENTNNPASSFDLWNHVVNVKSEIKGFSHLVEEEKTILLDLFGSIKKLNELLIHVNSRKIQYQKG